MVLSFSFTLPADNSTIGAAAVTLAPFPSIVIFEKFNVEVSCSTSNNGPVKLGSLFIVNVPVSGIGASSVYNGTLLKFIVAAFASGL